MLFDDTSLVTVEEGYNRDVVRSVLKDDYLYDLQAHLKAGKKAHLYGWRKKDISSYETAIKEYKKAKELSLKLKKKIYDMPGPETTLEKILSYVTPIMNPIFNFKFPRQEVYSMTIGDTTYTQYTTYVDDMSKNSKSDITRSFQERFNLFNHNLENTIKNCERSIGKIKKKAAKKAAKAKAKSMKESLALDMLEIYDNYCLNEGYSAEDFQESEELLAE